MPSLKDLKNRIASVKSTRKITKAMQMVAAAKLRRAQEAAEAARPYAERIQRRLGGARRRRASGPPRAAPARAGRGATEIHLLVVDDLRAGPLRRLQLVDRRGSRASEADRLLAEGKTVKILTVGKKGRERCAATSGQLLVGHVDLSAEKRMGYGEAAAIARDIIARYDAGEFDVATIFYNRFQSVISQVPTARQVIPATFEAATGACGRSTSTSPARRRSSPTCCRAAWRPRSSRRCWRTAPPSRARGCPPWTTPPATRAT